MMICNYDTYSNKADAKKVVFEVVYLGADKAMWQKSLPSNHEALGSFSQHNNLGK